MPGVTIGPIEISYGDFDFPVETETMGVRARPVLDRARRTIAYVVYGYTLRTIIADDTIPGNPDDQDGVMMETIRQQLMAPARTFIYKKEGFGNLNLNTEQTDVVWGPVPTGFTWKPKGGGRAAELTWSVDVAIPEFSTGRPGNYLEFNYTLSFGVSRAGLVTRRYSGYFKIPLTRPDEDDRTMHDNADRYLDDIIPAPIPGFRRSQPCERTIDEAKTTLTFSVVDEELPSVNVPPPGAVTASLSHSLETNNVAMKQWHGNIAASYELVKGINQKLAFTYFMRTVFDRISATQREQKITGLFPIPQKFSMREHDAYGAPTVDFSFAYMFTSSLENILGDSGMFRKPPVTMNDWDAWKLSMEQSKAWNARGLSQLEFKDADDSIVDIGSSVVSVPGPNRHLSPAAAQMRLNELFSMPPENNSWIDMENIFDVDEVDEAAILKLLPKNPEKLVDVARAVTDALGIKGWDSDYIKAGIVKHVIQQRATPTIFVTMRGWAIRVGYQIPKPRVTVVGGPPKFIQKNFGLLDAQNQLTVIPVLAEDPIQAVPVNLRGNGFSCGVVGNWGWPLYGAVWNLLYVLKDIPKSGITVPNNPLVAAGDVVKPSLTPKLKVEF